MISIHDPKRTSADALGGTIHSTPGSDVGTQASAVVNWRELAVKRLAKLVEAEHDVAVLRDRLDLHLSESLTLFRQRELLIQQHEMLSKQCEEHLRRVGQLERERDALFASKSWRCTKPLRALSARAARARSRARRLLRWLVRQPFVRPAIKLMVRLLPGISVRLHARLYAQGR